MLKPTMEYTDLLMSPNRQVLFLPRSLGVHQRGMASAVKTCYNVATLLHRMALNMAITKLSSREFNQDTSRAKRAAKRGPVFITARGRPSHVLRTAMEDPRINGGAKR